MSRFLLDFGVQGFKASDWLELRGKWWLDKMRLRDTQRNWIGRFTKIAAALIPPLHRYLVAMVTTIGGAAVQRPWPSLIRVLCLPTLLADWALSLASDWPTAGKTAQSSKKGAEMLGSRVQDGSGLSG